MLNGFLIKVQGKLQIRLECTHPICCGGEQRGEKSNVENWNQGPTSCPGFAKYTARTCGRTETAPGTLTCVLWLPAASLCTRLLLASTLQDTTRTFPVLPWEPQLPASSGFFAVWNAISRTASPAEGTLVLCNRGGKAIRMSGWLARGPQQGRLAERGLGSNVAAREGLEYQTEGLSSCKCGR